MKRTTILTALLALTLAACGPKADVDWSQWSPELRAELDAAVAAKDCGTLQRNFDQADANSDANKAHGRDSSELMAWLDQQMKAVGCYG